MRTFTINVYEYDELTQPAQAKARDWYRSVDTFEPAYEPIITAAALLGISFNETSNGERDIRYSGFGCQGDGASFVGVYTFEPSARLRLREEFPTNATLHDLADTLADIQSRVAQTLQARTEQNGRYVHAQTMTLADYSPENALTNDDADLMLATLRRFANWIYNELEDQYFDSQDEETVAENIRANEYEFTVNGKRRSSR